MNIEEFEKRKTLAITGLENRLGKEETLKFLGQVEHETKNELSITGNVTEEAERERIIWRLELKLDRLVSEERKDS